MFKRLTYILFLVLLFSSCEKSKDVVIEKKEEIIKQEIIEDKKEEKIEELKKEKEEVKVTKEKENLVADDVLKKIKDISENKDIKEVEEIKDSLFKIIYEDGIIKYYSNNYNKFITINDILRYGYKKRLASIDFSDVNTDVFEITNTSLIIGDNKKVKLDLDKYKYIFKGNLGLPSLYKGEILEPIKREVDENKKHIVFSFDDGPANKNHELIRQVFTDYDETAVFFVVGSQVKKHKDMLKETYLQGHQILNHTYNHPNLTKISNQDILKEFFKTNDEIFKTIGIDAKYIRPPYGAVDSRVKSVLGKKNIIIWDIDSEDWRNRNTLTIINRVLPNIKDGDIVLFHDLYPETYEAIKIMVPMLKEQGYQFINYDELIKIKYNKE